MIEHQAVSSSKIDIKYLGVPNICFSLVEKEDRRGISFEKQRLERGFDDSETWSLRDTIANFIVPRLERYVEITNEILKEEPELKEDIDCFLESMKLVSRDNGLCEFTMEEKQIVEKGINAFPKIFMSLWY